MHTSTRRIARISSLSRCECYPLTPSLSAVLGRNSALSGVLRFRAPSLSISTRLGAQGRSDPLPRT